MYPQRDSNPYGVEYQSNFPDEKSRRRFISKVCVIIFFQLLFTMGFGAMCYYVEDVKAMLAEADFTIYIGGGIAVAIQVAMAAFPNIGRKPPFNFLLLLLFTLSECIIVSNFIIQYEMDVIVMALGTTIGMVFGLIIFALCIPCDITGYGPYVAAMSWVTLGISLSAVYLENSLLSILICGVGLVASSAYFVYSVQLTVGQHHNKYDTRDYVFAALCLYGEIIHIFLYVLRLMGTKS